MNFFEKNRNLVFWALQLLGWGFVNVISLFVLSKFSTAFIVFSLASGIFVGVFCSALLRSYLKKAITFDNFSIVEILKICAATLLASAFYAILSYFFGYVYVKLGPEMTETELKILKSFGNVWILVVNSIFIIGVWVVCYLVIKLLLHLNKNRVERLALNANLKQAKLNTLKGQINPHFMFNSLNNIRGLMLEDVDKAREMLTKLSEMLRYSLTKNNITAIALTEELEMVYNYIELAKIQFENRLQFNAQIAPATKPLLLPPMLIQLLIENAVKHGIANLKNGGQVTLKTSKQSNHLNIEVSNSGCLKISKNTTQLGLKNIQQRLQLLYGNQAHFSLVEKDDLVVASLKIPLV